MNVAATLEIAGAMQLRFDGETITELPSTAEQNFLVVSRQFFGLDRDSCL